MRMRSGVFFVCPVCPQYQNLGPTVRKMSRVDEVSTIIVCDLLFGPDVAFPLGRDVGSFIFLGGVPTRNLVN